jgi:mannose-1-phosphate guanylyltransferase/mannose-6-phosphate isomerase
MARADDLANTAPLAGAALDRLWPVLLSGGSGTRLWPLSRTLYPKQLLPLAQPETMLQATAVRAADALRFQAPVVVAGEDHRFLIVDQLKELRQTPAAVLLEPQGRNTAPAIAIAALWIAARDPEGLMLVMPSDHVIADSDAFQAAIDRAVPAVRAGALATFGIAPDGPETGYGYIECGTDLADTPGVSAVSRFVEKPDRATAESYLATGRYVWNGGIFLFRVDRYLAELERLAPQVASACRAAMAGSTTDTVFVRPQADAFKTAPNISVDYAVMEKTDAACVVPVDMGWSDVGSWDALWQIGQKTADGNVTHGTVWSTDSHNNLLRSEGGPAIAAVGLNDMIVVSTADAVMVAPRARAQDVKLIVDDLKASGRDEWKLHQVVHRPWGTYQTTDSGDRFQTKRIVVKPGEKLSLQLHHHRSEHWIVVSGTARVTVGEQVILLQENQSTYIPAGTTHRLENPGKIPLHLIEVQCGSYLGEDDIVRLEDTYGRAGTTG